MLDEEMLYHGSLNVFSQHESGESMLRGKNQHQIIKALNEELQAPAITQPKTPTITKDEIDKLKTIPIPIHHLPELESKCVCGSRFIPCFWENSAFYGCENFRSYKHKSTVNITKENLQQIQDLQNKICVQCNSPLEIQLQGRPQLIILSCNQCKEKQYFMFTR